MSKVFTLDNYRQKADETYGSFTLRVDENTETTLRNPLRIDEKARVRVFELVDQMSEAQNKDSEEGKWNEVGGDDETSLEDLENLQPLLEEFISLVGDKNTPKLIEAIGGDLAILLNIFQDYFEVVGLGEASTSPESSTTGARKRTRTSSNSTKSA